MTRIDNEWAKFVDDSDGPAVRTMDCATFAEAVAEGRIPGYSSSEILGENQEVTAATYPEDVWDFGGLYNFSAGADIDRISSSDNGDTHNILIEGLDTNWEGVTQVKTLTGHTPVALTTPLVRINSMMNIGSVDISGMVYCYVDGSVTDGVPDDSSSVRAMINGTANTTLMAIYTVPSNKFGYLYNGYASISRAVPVAASAWFSAYARAPGGVFVVRARVSCCTAGSSFWDRAYSIPRIMPPGTDILIRCESVSSTVGVAGGFSVLLKETS